jgi:hypothetical protein
MLKPTEPIEPTESNIDTDFGKAIAEVSKGDVAKPDAVSEAAVLDEAFGLSFAKRIPQLYLICKRILTISFVPILFGLVVLWLIVVVLFVLAAAFKLWSFYLADSVLIDLITSTTATVLGLFHYVARWLFAVHPKDPDPPDEPTSKNQSSN